MRKDMAKVIVERPRRGSRLKGNQKGRRVRDLDDLPSRQSMHRVRRKFFMKELNENLSPLKRFLNKQVGRPWDKVYSEISQYLRPTSAVQQHVRDHVRDFVNIRAVWIDGRIYCEPHFGIQYPLRKGELYVHPHNGLLCRVTK